MGGFDKPGCFMEMITIYKSKGRRDKLEVSSLSGFGTGSAVTEAMKENKLRS